MNKPKTRQKDDFTRLRQRYEDEIRRLEQELESLRGRLVSLLSFADENERFGNGDCETVQYHEKGLSECALDALDKLSINGTEWITPRQICDYMVTHGFRPVTAGNAFCIAVAVTLKRLAKAGRAKTSAVGMGRFYGPIDKNKVQ